MLSAALSLTAVFAAIGLIASAAAAQQKSQANAARTLLLPKSAISGDRATLAVLDASGRLVPKAHVVFSNGDQYTTDATGRALFVAPLIPGVLHAGVAGRGASTSIAILPANETNSSSMTIAAVPEFATLTDRFEIAGSGFCGDADANHVTISGLPAFILAASPTSLTVMPSIDLPPGRASVDLSCAKRRGPPIEIVFVELMLQADTSPLAQGVIRELTVHVRGTQEKVALLATNLAPEIAELEGGNSVRATSSGGLENAAHFKIVGRAHGNFAVSVRLVSRNVRPR
ncbi:MAG TPA: hypothetical protein VJN93_10070 [Candidatus Acidoferrum sp.]|nr:hypothetical protein [Candidatus Acidoferrum sp.]